MSTKKNNIGFESICIKDNFDLSKNSFSHTPPIYASSTFVYESPEKTIRVFQGKEKAFIYNRWGTPNTELVEEKIASLESFGIHKNGNPLKLHAVIFSSGMAAISSIFMSLGLKSGDCVITQGNLYGSTTEFLDSILSRLGVKIIFTDLKNLALTEKLIQANPYTRILYMETPSNPTIDCYDLESLTKLAKKYKIKSAIDNTFATPYLQQPFKYDIDFVAHSTTKYLNGHSNALGGIVIGKDIDFMQKEVWKMRKLFGGSISSFDAWLLNNGIKTLPIRMEKHCTNAMAIAQMLEKHSGINKVNYLGLKTHPDHLLAKKQMKNFGGMMSFELKGGIKAGIRFMKKIRFCTLTATLGTPDTLIQHPASMTHVQVPKKQREQYGISDGLIRLSVGIENVQDIITDLKQAIDN